MVAFNDSDIEDYRINNGLVIRVKQLDLSPRYFGSWNPKKLEDGLFGVFIVRSDDNKHSGVILDGLGTAEFSGDITPVYIDFVKKYHQNAVERGAAKGPLKYMGWKEGKDNFYKGRFFGDDENGSFYFFPTESLNLSDEMLKRAFSWLLMRGRE